MIVLPVGGPFGSLLFLVCFCTCCLWFVVCPAVPTQLFAARFGLHSSHSQPESQVPPSPLPASNMYHSIK
jgi:hypothetical protein